MSVVSVSPVVYRRGPSFENLLDLAAAECHAVYEHGWQSWSPAGLYRPGATTPRPRRAIWQTMAYRPERPAASTGAQGEGLLAVVDQTGECWLVAAAEPRREVPSIRAQVVGGRLVVSADGDVVVSRHASLASALTSWADGAAAAQGVQLRSLPAGWCSWYGHGPGITHDDVVRTVDDLDRLALPVEVVQVDDGYQAGIGDWLTCDPRYGSVAETAKAVTASGRTAGIWTAPFLVGRASELAQQHPDWLVRGAVACERHWDQQVGVLDVTHPGAQEWLLEVYGTLAAQGFAFHKLDFLYGGAMEGGRHADCSALDAYVLGLELVRRAVGPDAVLLGCGAPLLPSIGLVDAMRVSPDVAPEWEPPAGDVSQPGMRSALLAGEARAWQQHRLWTLDPDCLLLRPSVTPRAEWAAHVRRLGGLAVLSDRLDNLDPAGVALAASAIVPTDPQFRPAIEPPLLEAAG